MNTNTYINNIMSKSSNAVKGNKVTTTESNNNTMQVSNNSAQVMTEQATEQANAMPIAVAESSAQVSKDLHKDLTIESLCTIAREQLTQFASIRAIKAESNYKALVDKYGKKNADAIVKQCKAFRVEVVDSSANAVISEFNDYTKALNSEFARLKSCKGFAEYSELIANVFESASEFIAECYPNTINGKPARVVSYIRNSKTYIADTYEPRTLQGKNATAFLLECLANMRKHCVKAIRNGKDNEKPRITNAREQGAIYAVYEAEKVDDKRAYIKGDKVKGDKFNTIAKAGLADYISLSEFRKSTE